MVDDGEVIIGWNGDTITRHPLMAPGEVSIYDEHYQSKSRLPAWAVRVRTGSERAFMALGPVAEAFLRSAAAAGTSRLATELADIVTLELSWGRAQLLAALERATRFRRFKAQDIRSILEAGPQAPNPAPSGKTLEWIRAKENLCLVGPAGTGKAHLPIGVGHAAAQAGLRVRYFTASDLV